MIGPMLSALRDVDGVFGSFVVSKTGALAGRDLPAVFEDRVLSEVGPRLVRLHDTLSAGGQTLDSCVMRFADHKLHVRVLQNGLLCVLTSNQANASALKMAVTLTARRVDPTIVEPAPTSHAAAPTSHAGSPTPAPPSITAAPPSVARKQGMYRGHRIP
jgi:predicted regulator of Ras-like GTPase activity (Roadblock/LC7/MglB family)